MLIRIAGLGLLVGTCFWVGSNPQKLEFDSNLIAAMGGVTASAVLMVNKPEEA